MMRDTIGIKSGKQELQEHIARHVAILFRNINSTQHTITIHTNSSNGDDYPRMIFVVYTLARAYRCGFVTDSSGAIQEELVELFWKLYDHSKRTLSLREFIYVQLYGIRFLTSFGHSVQRIIEDFMDTDHSSIYTHPISAYLYMSTYQESDELRSMYHFSEDIFLLCKQVFDYMLFSNRKEALLPFYFAELSYQQERVENYMVEQAYVVVRHFFATGYPSETASSSGVAKCMEDFARRGDEDLFQVCVSFLEQRQLSRFTEYIPSSQIDDSEYLYTEDAYSQHVCLDTNAHLVHAYLTLYEKIT